MTDPLTQYEQIQILELFDLCPSWKRRFPLQFNYDIRYPSPPLKKKKKWNTESLNFQPDSTNKEEVCYTT